MRDPDEHVDFVSLRDIARLSARDAMTNNPHSTDAAKAFNEAMELVGMPCRVAVRDDELVVKVAKALCRVTRLDPNALGVDGNPRWKGWVQYAEPAIEAAGVTDLQARLERYETALTAIKLGHFSALYDAEEAREIARKALGDSH